MKPRNFAYLEMPEHTVKQQTKDSPVKDVYGWDTETFNGEVTLIAVYGKDYFDYIIPDNYLEIITFMTEKRFRRSLNFFFNLKYDQNAIIKSMPKSVFNTMFYADSFTCPTFKITTMGKKCLSIGIFKDKKFSKTGKECIRYDTSKFFDIMVFYQIGSLEKTCNEVFERGYKKSITIDGGIRKQDITAEHIRYCISDAKACYRLADNLVSITNQQNPISYYYSPATLAKSLIKRNLIQIYNTNEYRFNPKDKINQCAFNSYQGGRFEIIKKGTFDNVYSYDINSAYPFIISKLNSLEGKRMALEGGQFNRDSIHGFYQVELNIHDCLISPIKYFNKNLLIYPKGEFTSWITKSELELLIKHGLDFKVLRGWEIRGEENKPLQFIQDLYNERQRLKSASNPLQLYYKLVLNSLYGVMLQMVQRKKVYRLDTMTIRELCDINMVSIPQPLYQFKNMYIRDISFDADSYDKYTTILKNISSKNKIFSVSDILHLQVKKYRLGSYFNPIWGSEITADTRNMLYDCSIKHEDKILMFATDSITSEKKLKVPISKKLGDWKEDKITDCKILASGIYEMDGENKFRGLDNKIKLQELFQLCHDEYEFISKRPLGLREALPKADIDKPDTKIFTERDRYKYFNTFIPFSKKLCPTIDRKRNWFKEPKTFRDLLDNQYESLPLRIGNGVVYK